ncbi:hypothetical protein [Brevundimonas sp.]|uniref:hypothetical protein n=1 Tax=Brevundimonas sp. TaxID=1871086 RepID=UPI0039E4F77B
MTVFADKLDDLPRSIEAAGTGTDLGQLGEALRTGLKHTAVAVGSGGSAIAAHYLALCRQTLQAEPTLVQTPLQFAIDEQSLETTDIWLFSAGGSNPDILAAFEGALARGARSIQLVTASTESPLARRCKGVGQAQVHWTPTCGARDGFLATHSLISAVTALLLASDYSSPAPDPPRVLQEWRDQAGDRLAPARRAEATERYRSLRRTDTLFLLQDPRLDAAGVLIETCAWEAGLCAVQRTDFRNFAHGRHVWLAHRGAEAFVLALTGRETRAIWADIDTAIPDDIRRDGLDAGGCGRFENAALILDGLVLVEAMGAAVGIDPGRPGAGAFAEALYESDALYRAVAAREPAVRLKTAATRLSDQPDRRDLDLDAAWVAFRNRLAEAEFRGLVVDYDGTLVADGKVEDPVSGELVTELVRLLDEGLAVAVATGRGGSGGDALRGVVPKAYWDSVIISYYNGAYTQPLTTNIEQDRPVREARLDPARDWLTAVAAGGERLDYKDSLVQLTLKVASLADTDLFRRRFDSEANSAGLLRIARSSHTLDICLAETCKTTVAGVLATRLSSGMDSILCLGDSGAVAGNDYALLGLPAGVSVGRVCDRPDRGWNLFGSRIRGPDAVLRILRALRPVNGAHRLDVETLFNLDLSAGSA